MKRMKTGWLTLVIGLGMALTPLLSAAQESIGVSGYWKITVSDPDGSNAEVYEFSNALTSEGSELLEQILTDLAVPAPLPSDDVCFGIVCLPGFECSQGTCFQLCNSGLDAFEPIVSNNGMPAKIEVYPMGEPNNPIALSAEVRIGGVFQASWQANRPVDVVKVSTTLGEDACFSPDFPQVPAPALTTKELASPIAVANGQLLNIEVDISFSTAATP